MSTLVLLGYGVLVGGVDIVGRGGLQQLLQSRRHGRVGLVKERSGSGVRRLGSG
jgi:hypothetical protein